MKYILGLLILIVGNIIWAYLFSLLTVPFFCAYSVSKHHVSNAKIREFPENLGRPYTNRIVWVNPKFLRYMRTKAPSHARNHLLIRLLFPTFFLVAASFNTLRGLYEARWEAFLIGVTTGVIHMMGLYLAYGISRRHLR